MRAVLFFVLLLSGVAPAEVCAQAAVTAAVAVTPVPASSFTLRPGDVVRLKIWREPDLSGDYAVDEAGRINFPLIGMQVVVGETTESLQRRLREAYQRSVQDLAMTVMFLRRIPVVGAVRVPGLYPIEPTMTIADAVALAGGATTDPERTQINILRNGRVLLSSIDPSLRVSQFATEPGDQVYVPANVGFFSRYPWVATSAVQLFIAVVTTIIITQSR